MIYVLWFWTRGMNWLLLDRFVSWNWYFWLGYAVLWGFIAFDLKIEAKGNISLDFSLLSACMSWILAVWVCGQRDEVENVMVLCVFYGCAVYDYLCGSSRISEFAILWFLLYFLMLVIFSQRFDPTEKLDLKRRSHKEWYFMGMRYFVVWRWWDRWWGQRCRLFWKESNIFILLQIRIIVKLNVFYILDIVILCYRVGILMVQYHDIYPYIINIDLTNSQQCYSDETNRRRNQKIKEVFKNQLTSILIIPRMLLKLWVIAPFLAFFDVM